MFNTVKIIILINDNLVPMRLLKILFKNFMYYGFLTYVKIIIFEISYTIYFFRFKDYVTSAKNTLAIKNKKNSYDSMNLPTPYYFLKIIDKHLNTKKKLFIDFGCGNSRVLNFFQNKFESLIGFEINIDFINMISRKIKIHNIDLRKISNLKKNIAH